MPGVFNCISLCQLLFFYICCEVLLVFRRNFGCSLAAVLLAMGTASRSYAQAAPLDLFSPDQQLVMHFKTVPTKTSSPGEGQLVYCASFHGKQILDDSGLGLELGDQPILGADVRIAGSSAGHGIDDFVLTNTKTSKVHDAYNSLSVDVGEVGGQHRKMTIEARAYNGGIAFRYILPKQSGLQEVRLKQEHTEFRLPTDAIDWALALPSYRSSYESEYVQLPTSALSNQGGVPSHFLIGLPLLMHEPGAAWLSLMEANIEGNSSMYVTNPSGNWAGHWLVSQLAPRFDEPEIAVRGTSPYHSAWRVLLVADDPGRLVESNIVYDLSPMSRLQDTSWIHSGKASWNWWVGDLDKNGKPAYTTDNMKYYVDFAAQSGFPYMMLDAGWSAAKDITQLNGKVDVPELVRYAATKNVRVWIWLYSGSVAKQMKEAFPLYEKWGVAGIKIDFVNRDDQEGVQFYYDVAREAAAHHMLVDFHGTRTPWGLERTYPNVLSFEGVLGMENSKVGRRDSPVDRTVFPFTRLVAGPMDYTPGGFNNVTEDEYEPHDVEPLVMGTRAQQLALYVVFQTPIQMVSDSPQAYAGQAAFQFIKDVPVSWDSTRVLNGRPGEFVTIVRSHGNEWYLGSITNWTPRTLEIPLSFLGTGSYIAEIYEDAADAGSDPKHVTVHKQTVRKSESLALHLAPGGGCAIRFVPRTGR
jgi:alpha-glucosidase